MNIADTINGTFELLGGVAILGHCKTLLKDKMVKGVNWGSVIFFTLWGFWNIYYFPHLDQWISFYGGIFIVLMNIFWLILIFKYTLLEKRNKSL